jgi:hypothetical protein
MNNINQFAPYLKEWTVSTLVDRLIVWDRWNENGLWDPNRFGGLTYENARDLATKELIRKTEVTEQMICTAEWGAYNDVLGWINTQDKKMISKGDLYDAVMEMRPKGLEPWLTPSALKDFKSQPELNGNVDEQS